MLFYCFYCFHCWMLWELIHQHNTIKWKHGRVCSTNKTFMRVDHGHAVNGQWLSYVHSYHSHQKEFFPIVFLFWNLKYLFFCCIVTSLRRDRPKESNWAGWLAVPGGWIVCNRRIEGGRILFSWGMGSEVEGEIFHPRPILCRYVAYISINRDSSLVR